MDFFGHFRMDVDHSGRYLAQKFYGIRDPDYYEFEGRNILIEKILKSNFQACLTFKNFNSVRVRMYVLYICANY